MWFIGVEVEQKTSAPPPKKNPGSAPDWVLDETITKLNDRRGVLTLGLTRMGVVATLLKGFSDFFPGR